MGGECVCLSVGLGKCPHPSIVWIEQFSDKIFPNNLLDRNSQFPRAAIVQSAIFSSSIFCPNQVRERCGMESARVKVVEEIPSGDRSQKSGRRKRALKERNMSFVVQKCRKCCERRIWLADGVVNPITAIFVCSPFVGWAFARMMELIATKLRDGGEIQMRSMNRWMDG